MALVGNLRLWTVQELVSSVLLCNHKSIQDETVRKVCENFQYLDMGIFVHILSGRCKKWNLLLLLIMIMSARTVWEEQIMWKGQLKKRYAQNVAENIKYIQLMNNIG